MLQRRRLKTRSPCSVEHGPEPSRFGLVGVAAGSTWHGRRLGQHRGGIAFTAGRASLCWVRATGAGATLCGSGVGEGRIPCASARPPSEPCSVGRPPLETSSIALLPRQPRHDQAQSRAQVCIICGVNFGRRPRALPLTRSSGVRGPGACCADGDSAPGLSPARVGPLGLGPPAPLAVRGTPDRTHAGTRRRNLPVNLYDEKGAVFEFARIPQPDDEQGRPPRTDRAPTTVVPLLEDRRTSVPTRSRSGEVNPEGRGALAAGVSARRADTLEGPGPELCGGSGPLFCRGTRCARAGSEELHARR